MGRRSGNAQGEGAGVAQHSPAGRHPSESCDLNSNYSQGDASFRWHDEICLEAEQQVDRVDAFAKLALQPFERLRVRLLARLMLGGERFQPRRGGCGSAG